jgi:hypothetical protein
MKQAGSLKDELRKQAEYYKELYIKGEISQEYAKEMIQPYLNVLNYSIRRIGKAYRMYIKEQTFEDFMKYRY